MPSRRIRNLEDLARLERRQIDASDARRVVAINEKPAAVGDAVGLRQLGMVRVIPWNEAIGRLEHRLRLLVVAVAGFRVLREDADDLEQASGGEPVDPDLPVEPAGKEGVVLVVLP